MPVFMMIMKSAENGGNSVDWDCYINSLVKSGMFSGGSALGKGVPMNKEGARASAKCVVTGYMRFEAAVIEDVLALVPGNPVFEAGGEVEVLELLET